MKTDIAHSRLRAAKELGHEARIRDNDHAALKLWLRLLTCTTQIEDEVRRRLRAKYNVSLARFDYLAQLYRHGGLKMRDLSRYLMVTGGNVTGLADELEKEGLVARLADPHDRRTSRVSLTKKGQRLFDKLAATHESWIVSMFGGMKAGDMRQLYDHLGVLRVHLAAQQPAAGAATPSASTTTARRRRRPGALT